ncbi:MAG: PEP-CTERM sorting domain-containing protein [Proteobacteria bacterium]|nr:PEP-CTERM sorting domain-containing protein [Pseudomonadota bacterium]
MARLRRTAFLVAIGALLTPVAHADALWHWRYEGQGIHASGTFTATDTADAAGFHHITDITGERNSDPITRLYPTGQAIPGNEPYAVDNLVRPGDKGQLTLHGFGFALASGAHANPFFDPARPAPGYMEVLITPAGFREQPVRFSAAPAGKP